MGSAGGNEGLPPEDAAARLADLRAETLATLRTDAPVGAPFQALRAVARRHDFPERWPMDLIAGFAMDVDGARYQTPDDTLRYAYHVAGVVGVMMARVMGVRDDAVLDRACDLGLAFQLTNIARDVIDDARIGRLYLPSDWLEEAGASVEGNIPSPQLYGVILRLLDAAEPYYASARAGLPALPLRGPACARPVGAARLARAVSPLGLECRVPRARPARLACLARPARPGLRVRPDLPVPLWMPGRSGRCGSWRAAGRCCAATAAGWRRPRRRPARSRPVCSAVSPSRLSTASI